MIDYEDLDSEEIQEDAEIGIHPFSTKSNDLKSLSPSTSFKCSRFSGLMPDELNSPLMLRGYGSHNYGMRLRPLTFDAQEDEESLSHNSKEMEEVDDLIQLDMKSDGRFSLGIQAAPKSNELKKLSSEKFEKFNFDQQEQPNSP